MKRVICPEPIAIKHPNSHAENDLLLRFEQWLEELITLDERSGKSAKTLFLAFDVRSKLREITLRDQTELFLSDSEYELVRQIVEQPSTGYFTPIAIQIVPFVRAILSAPDLQS